MRNVLRWSLLASTTCLLSALSTTTASAVPIGSPSSMHAALLMDGDQMIPVAGRGYRSFADDDDDEFDDLPPPRQSYGYGYGYGYVERPMIPPAPVYGGYGYAPPPPRTYYGPPVAEWLPPPRPSSCGQYRYWDGDRCADARRDPPYIGPRW